MPLSDYQVRAELSQGGKGVVLRGYDPRRMRPVLLHRLRAETDQVLVRRFLREGEALERLRHPHVVEVFEVGQEPGGEAFLVTESVGGESLQARLEREGPLPERAALELFLQLADAIDHAHAVGVLHRDLRPANVWLDRRGQVRLTHFGLVKDMTATDGTTYLGRDGAFLGTLGYASPEQVGPLPDGIGTPVDAYGLGGVLFAMLCGRAPVVGGNQMELLLATQEQAPPRLRALREELSGFSEELCAGCLRKAPGSRLPVTGLVDAVAGWLAVERPEAPDGREPLLYHEPGRDERHFQDRPDPLARIPRDDHAEPGDRPEDDVFALGDLVVKGPLTAAQMQALTPVLAELRGIDAAAARALTQRMLVPVLEGKTQAAREAVAAQLAALGIEAHTPPGPARAPALTPVCVACRRPGGDDDPLAVTCSGCGKRLHPACAVGGACPRCT